MGSFVVYTPSPQNLEVRLQRISENCHAILRDISKNVFEQKFYHKRAKLEQ